MTYRHGKEIFDNSQDYIERMSVKEPCDVGPSDKPGEVVTCYGDEWLDVVESRIPYEMFEKSEENDGKLKASILNIAATSEWASQMRKAIQERLSDCGIDMPFINLGDMRIAKRVIRMYNTIAALERGESVPWNWNEHKTGSSSSSFVEDSGERDLDDYMPIKSLFASSPALPTHAIVDNSHVNQDGKGIFETRKEQILKNVKSSIRKGTFGYKEEYDRDSFEKAFISSSKWNGIRLVQNIPDIGVLPDAIDIFPDYAPLSQASKRLSGTIHRAKGMEKDIVILGMAVPYPALKHIDEVKVRDDICRQFYVGTSRPRKLLIEVNDYLRYGGRLAPAPLDVIPHSSSERRM
jgi:hypothetical protein